MRTRWFDAALESVAMLWRIERCDGVTLGFAAHDRDLWIDDLIYRAAPGMLPSAIELDDGLEPSDMDVRGALDHAAIDAGDLAAGRWDGASVRIGLVDWRASTESVAWLLFGRLGVVECDGAAFSAQLMGRKVDLQSVFTPVASPGCRAEFCGPGCTLSRARFEHLAVVVSLDGGLAAFSPVAGLGWDAFVGGEIHWLTGANAGLRSLVWRVDGAGLVPADPLPLPVAIGDRALLIQGCDKSIETCATRFANAINFQGEPHLPGNDLLTRYPGG